MGPAEFVRTNVIGTQVLLDAALKHAVGISPCFGGLKSSGHWHSEDTNKFTELEQITIPGVPIRLVKQVQII